MDFGKLGVNLNSYIEVALGLSKRVNSKLTVGGRLKYLAGIANAHMTDSELDDGDRERWNDENTLPAEYQDHRSGEYS